MTSPSAIWETEKNIPLTRLPDNPARSVGATSKRSQSRRSYPRHRRDGGLSGRSDGVNSGAMIALIPTVEDAARLAVPDGESPDELHVTLVYLGDGADFNDHVRQALQSTVAAITARTDLITADGFALSVFNPGETNEHSTCIVLGVAGDGLSQIHDAVSDAAVNLLDITGPGLPGQHDPWLPHLTLIYTDDVAQIASLTDRVGPIVFDRVRVAFAGDYTDIPLKHTDTPGGG